MLLEIESYKRDTLLYGKNISEIMLKQQIHKIEKLYDKNSDNFVELLCRMYGWNILNEQSTPDFTYDRDTMKLYEVSV